MTSFLKTVCEALPRLQKESGFVAARKLAGSDFVSFVKRHSDHAYFYVFVSDGRSGNAPVDVCLWVAPPDAPDDGLDNLLVGFKILIAHSFTADDAFFHRCDDRIVRLIPHLNSLAERVTGEIEAPSFETKRLQVYRIERRVFAVLRGAAGSRHRALLNALEAGRNTAQGGISFKKLEDACISAGRALAENELLEPDILTFYAGNYDLMGGALANHVYVHSLVETVDPIRS